MVGLGPSEAESRWDLGESCGGDCVITLLFKEYLWPDRIKNTPPPWGGGGGEIKSTDQVYVGFLGLDKTKELNPQFNSLRLGLKSLFLSQTGFIWSRLRDKRLSISMQGVY